MSRLLPDRDDPSSTRAAAYVARLTRGGRTVLLTALATSTACYQYLPNQASDLRVGEEVRLHLTGSGSAALRPLVGSDVETIDGRVLSRGDSVYEVSVGGTTKREGGGSAVWNGEQLRIPAGAIARVDRRVLSSRKTLLLSAAAVAVAALIAGIISSVSGGGSGGPDTGTTPP